MPSGPILFLAAAFRITRFSSCAVISKSESSTPFAFYWRPWEVRLSEGVRQWLAEFPPRTRISGGEDVHLRATVPGVVCTVLLARSKNLLL